MAVARPARPDPDFVFEEEGGERVAFVSQDSGMGGHIVKKRVLEYLANALGSSVYTDVSGSPDLSCASAALPPSVASLTDCTLVLGVGQTERASGLAIEVALGGGAALSIEVPFSVYAISALTIQAV